MTTPFNQDLISDILGNRPELAFLGNVGQANLPRGLENFFRTQTSPFLQRFNQAVGQQLVGGNLPTLTPESFFSGINFQREKFNFSPQARGEGISRFLGRGTRFI